MTATRREALSTIAVAAAFATVPAVAAEPTVPIDSDRSKWERLLAERDELRKASESHSRNFEGVVPKSEQWKRLTAQEDALSSRIAAVEDTIMDTPAPDGEALLWKIEHFFTPADTLWSEDYAEQFYADARRILSAGRA